MNRYFYLALFLIFCIQFSHAQNVGIGTVNPRGKLEIAHNVYKQSPTLVLLDSGSIGWGPQILFQNVNAMPNYLMLNTSVSTIATSASFFNFKYNGTDIMTIRGDGQVGINKYRPGYALDVGGNSNVDGTLRINTMSSTTKPTLLLHDSSTVVNFAPGPRIEFKNSNPAAESFKIQTLLSTDHNDSYMDITFANDYIMTFSGDKKVGVNNFFPQHTLDIQGDVNITDALLVNGNAGTAGQVLTSTGSGAPEWRAPASGETGPRFYAVVDEMKTNLDPSQHLEFVSASIYNSAPADIAISLANDEIHLIKPGIYHFDITGHVDVLPGNPAAGFRLYLDNVLPGNGFMRIINAVDTGGDPYSFSVSFDVYIPAGASPLSFSGNLYTEYSTQGSFRFTVTGHWVSD